jgi:integrase/recombinase XerD
MHDNTRRDALYSLARQHDADAGPADQKAFVDEALARLENAVDPDQCSVTVRTSQDRADADQVRLTAEQVSALLPAPGVDTPQGLRDTAVIAVMLCAGTRKAELAAPDVRDLRQRLGGEPALHVREGKGCKERLVPYGELSWVLAILDRWLAVAGISAGAVFRGFYKGNERLRPGRLSVRAIQCILAGYPVMIDGELVAVKPHGLRRTYARRLYEAGIDLVAIQQNLGHADVKTTLGYIGALDAGKRRAPAIYSFDLNRLTKAWFQGHLPGVST